MLFREITKAEARPIISRYHYAPFPETAEYCFGASDNNELIAAAAFSPLNNEYGVTIHEYMAFGKSPDARLQISALNTYCIRELRKKGSHLVATFCEAVRGDGTAFKGSSWNYDGRRNWSKTEFRLDGERNIEGRFHLYWKPFTAVGVLFAKRLGLTEKPYPKQKLIA